MEDRKKEVKKMKEEKEIKIIESEENEMEFVFEVRVDYSNRYRYTSELFDESLEALASLVDSYIRHM